MEIAMDSPSSRAGLLIRCGSVRHAGQTGSAKTMEGNLVSSEPTGKRTAQNMTAEQLLDTYLDWVLACGDIGSTKRGERKQNHVAGLREELLRRLKHTELAEQAKRTILAVGHRVAGPNHPGCAFSGCTCGAVENFKAEQCEFWRQVQALEVTK